MVMITPLLFTMLLIYPSVAAQDAPPAADDFRPERGWKPLGKSLWFDPKEKRLIIRARVAINDGYLEHLLCLEQTKEHESLLATAATPKLIHAGLLLTGAEAGHPVRFRPKFEPPAGTAMAIELEWTDKDGKLERSNAREWVKDQKSQKPLAIDWVFAGSDEFVDPETKRRIYAADGGDLFTVSNFTSAILDLPIDSSADDNARSFLANTPRIPPRGTFVTMFLRPVDKPKPTTAEPKAARKSQ
jgi:hypothetical protein